MPVSKYLTASFGSAALTLGALTMSALLMPTAAAAAPAGTGLSSVTVPDMQQVQQVRWRRYGGGYYPRYYGYRGYGYGGRDAAVAAGVIGGLAVGAAIAGAAAAPPPPPAYAPAYGPPGDWLAYCASKYRSFDPASGTYLGYDGLRHPCQ